MIKKTPNYYSVGELSTDAVAITTDQAIHRDYQQHDSDAQALIFTPSSQGEWAIWTRQLGNYPAYPHGAKIVVEFVHANLIVQVQWYVPLPTAAHVDKKAVASALALATALLTQARRYVAHDTEVPRWLEGIYASYLDCYDALRHLSMATASLTDTSAPSADAVHTAQAAYAVCKKGIDNTTIVPDLSRYHLSHTEAQQLGTVMGQGLKFCATGVSASEVIIAYAKGEPTPYNVTLTDALNQKDQAVFSFQDITVRMSALIDKYHH